MPHTLAETIAREIRAEMGRQRISARRVAEHLDLDQASVSRRLAGQIEFRPSEVEKVAVLLGVPVTKFMQAEPTTASAA